MAEANGIPISVEEFEVKRKAYTFEGYSENDYKKILQRLARTKVLFKMAQDEGLDINFEEALPYSLKEREEVLKDKEALNRINVYIEALGLSPEEYWNKYHVNEVILFKSITKFINKIIEDAKKDNKLKNLEAEKQQNLPQEYIDFVNDYIAIYVVKNIYQYKSSRSICFCIIKAEIFTTYKVRKMFRTILIYCKLFSAKHIILKRK